MEIADWLELAENLEKNGGWFFDFLAYFIASSLVVLFLIYLYRLATGKSDFLGRSAEDGNEQILHYQLEALQREKDDLEDQLVLVEKERKDLMEERNQIKQQLEKKSDQVGALQQQIQELIDQNQTLTEKIEDEMYMILQILLSADEVAAAIVNKEQFLMNRDDIYTNVLEYLISAIDDYRKKEPRIVIHVENKQDPDRFYYFAHSSGHSHRVKQYHPLKEGSAAGKAWSSNQVYYIPDVNDKTYEYQRKRYSRQTYRTLLCVPLILGVDEATKIGVLSITGKMVDAYNDQDIQMAVLFSSLLYPLIHRELQEKQDDL